ncbi:MAG: hypothetical protein ACI35V_11315 [Sphingobacterium composti]
MKYSVILLFIVCLYGNNGVLYATETYCEKSETDTIQPEYPGGIQAFRKYISNSMRHSLITLMGGISDDKMIVSFNIDTLGNLIDHKIEKAIDRHYIDEVLRVLKNSKPWTPGSINGIRKKVHFKLPIRIANGNRDLTSVHVFINGGMVPANDVINRLSSPFVPYNYYDVSFSSALFSKQTKNAMVVINDPKEKKALKKHLENTFEILRKVDTTKFQLEINDVKVDFETFQKSLHLDSTENIYIYPIKEENGYIGKINLLSHIINNKHRENHFKWQAYKESFFAYINRYRKGEQELSQKAIFVDDYLYQKKWVTDSINTDIIERIYFREATNSADAKNDIQRDGYYQIFTRDYKPNQETIYRQKVQKLIDEYKKSNIINNEFIIFLNNQKVNLDGLTQYSVSRFSKVHIITLERAKDLFGQHETKPIIYLHM